MIGRPGCRPATVWRKSALKRDRALKDTESPLTIIASKVDKWSALSTLPGSLQWQTDIAEVLPCNKRPNDVGPVWLSSINSTCKPFEVAFIGRMIPSLRCDITTIHSVKALLKMVCRFRCRRGGQQSPERRDELAELGRLVEKIVGAQIDADLSVLLIGKVR